MPSATTGLWILTRRNEILTDEWCELLEARRAQIKPHLSSFTLQELRQTECLQMDSHLGGIYYVSDDIVTADEGLSLDSQGIFSFAHQSVQRTGYGDYPDGSLCVWGLTRSGDWIVADIQFKGEPGYKRRGCQRAVAVSIRKCGPATILEKTKESPDRLWLQLGRVVRGFVTKRKRLYDDALALMEEVDAEERALAALLKNMGA